eukprot:CAMPEP_0181178208 /NCGR_PEP_ID=MMETSP1096-20121128/5600_1 /TAXON_ID=156174 ORGANISM="Chrysochromulina ericina, Strain CCMP281" /NCGR_SAMPLE_ID=MMETSP1096 /ASSEMBLY_ACC=CAM_ASM_000453 /LENGTH=35 /DNA_ID= /DNA_START= /DNA_END= /DNA_ORIENTATION=
MATLRASITTMPTPVPGQWGWWGDEAGAQACEEVH